MGKKFDRFVLTLALAGFIYLLLLREMQGGFFTVLLSVSICALVLRIIRRIAELTENNRWLQQRKYRKSCKGILMNLACAGEKETLDKLSALLKHYHSEDLNAVLIQYPPDCELNSSALFDIWKKHVGIEKLAVIATCRFSESCRTLAAQLRTPRLALVDAELLTTMIAEHPEDFPAQNSAKEIRKINFRKLGHLFLNRRNVPRCLLFAATMLGFYLLNGAIAYLVCSMLLIYLALVSLHRRQRPIKLF